MRIGVGNRILRNHRYFIESGRELIDELAARRYLVPSSRVLELGCGCGRNAIAFAAFLNGHGTYAGQDVDAEMIHWCQQHLQTPRATFHHANLYSKVYNPSGQPATTYRFPADDDSVTLIASVSVFSHLLYADARHYIRESARVLAPGGYLHMTLFLLDYLRDRLGDRWTFSHPLDGCHVDSLRYPEAAVAFELSTLRSLFAEQQLSVAEIYNTERHQQTVVARKP
jgi:SAM-dependent methyltransferase